MGRQTEIPTAIMPFNIAQAVNEIRREDGVVVDVVSKSKGISKFGRNKALGTTTETIWSSQGNEVFVDDNLIDTISTTAVGGVQHIRIEGHTIDADGNLTFAVQTATLNGQNKVTLTTPLARVSRAANAGNTDVLGTISVYQDTAITGGVPTDTTKIHIQILGADGENQSYKAATSTSQFDYLILTRLQLSVNRRQTATVDGSVESRSIGGIFTPKTGRMSVNSTGLSTLTIELNPALILRPNSDVRFVASASTTGVEASGTFAGYFASISR